MADGKPVKSLPGYVRVSVILSETASFGTYVEDQARQKLAGSKGNAGKNAGKERQLTPEKDGSGRDADFSR